MLRALFACILCWTLTASAQTCTVCGEVRGIREVSAARPVNAGAPRPSTAVGTASAADTGPVVGTVARFEFDRDRADSWHLGAAGTAGEGWRAGGGHHAGTRG